MKWTMHIVFFSALTIFFVAASCGDNSLGFVTGTDGDGNDDTDSRGNNNGGDTDSGSDNNGGDTDSDSDSEDVCGEINVVLKPETPTVVLLIDQSGSMDQDFGGDSRWDVVRSALLNDQTGIVKELESDIYFGLALYTSDGGYEGGDCPMLVEVAPRFDNYKAIKDVYDLEEPIGDTPTGESINAVASALNTSAPTERKIIVLATDGEPDTCDVPNPQQGQDVSVEAAQDAYTDGVLTYVISVGDDVSNVHLQDMANAGAGVGSGDPDAQYYLANNQTALISAFETIINGVRSCIFAMDGEVVAGMENKCQVKIDDDKIPYDDPDGWRLNSPSEMELLGASCEAIKTGEVAVDAKCPCDAVIQPG